MKPRNKILKCCGQSLGGSSHDGLDMAGTGKEECVCVRSFAGAKCMIGSLTCQKD